MSLSISLFELDLQLMRSFPVPIFWLKFYFATNQSSHRDDVIKNDLESIVIDERNNSSCRIKNNG